MESDSYDEMVPVLQNVGPVKENSCGGGAHPLLHGGIQEASSKKSRHERPLRPL